MNTEPNSYIVTIFRILFRQNEIKGKSTATRLKKKSRKKGMMNLTGESNEMLAPDVGSEERGAYW